MKIALVVLVGVLALGAGYFFFGGRPEPSEKMMISEKNDDVPVEGESTETVDKTPSLIGSIRDAMREGGQMRCTYTSGTGMSETTATVLVAGKQFYAQSQVAGQTASVLFDGETQYVWTAGTKQGMKMSQACLENLRSTTPDTNAKPANPDTAPTDYRQMLDAAKNVQCEPVETQPIETLLPKDVTFTDQCAMMDQAKKMMEQYKNQAPDRTSSGAVQY